MKRSATIVLLLAVIFMLSVPGTSLAEHKKWDGYLSFKGGMYWPIGDLEDLDFDSGFNGEVVVGMYVNPNLALEFGAGYFHTEAEIEEIDFEEENDVWVIPVIVNIKGVLPLERFELYGGGGFGLYFANMDVDGEDFLTGKYEAEDDETVFGGHILAGFNIDLSRHFFLGVEGKYVFTANARFFDTKVDLDGLTATGVLGIRF